MNKEAQLQLREKFYKETGMMWENSDEEPDIDYVEWLEAKVIAAQNDVSGNEALRVALPTLTKDLAWYIYSNNNSKSYLEENKKEFESMWDKIINKKDLYSNEDENGWG